MSSYSADEADLKVSKIDARRGHREGPYDWTAGADSPRLGEMIPKRFPPLPPDVTKTDLVKQFFRDVHGKEVQSAATYSYMWLADQVGHICVGMVLTFAASALLYFATYLNGLMGISGYRSVLFVIASPIYYAARLEEALGVSRYHGAAFVVASLIAAGWEYRAYKVAVRKAGGPFPLDRALLTKNAVIAAAYMILGAAMGWVVLDGEIDVLAAGTGPAALSPYLWTGLKFLGLILLAFLFIPFWLRQKIIWQKAGLPYVARLADGNSNVPQELADKLQILIDTDTPPARDACAVVIGGPIGSGRTALASAIGTEFAFRHRRVRYVRFGDLVEYTLAANFEIEPPPPGPRNIRYWPWSSAQVLVIDDLGPTLATALPASMRGTQAFHDWLKQQLGEIAADLGTRHTVWILDEDTPDGHERFMENAATIADVIGTARRLPIQLRKPSGKASDHGKRMLG